MQIPDFEPSFTAIRNDIEVTPEMSKLKHPLEYAAESLRLSENPYNKMNSKSLYITNFPKDVKITQEYVQNLCLEKGDRSALIKRIEV